MIRLTYRNRAGTVTMDGGGRGAIRMIALDGLGMPDKSFQVAQYAQQPGQETLFYTDNARSITVKCDIVAGVGRRNELSRVIGVFNEPGTLTVDTDARRRDINCYCNVFESLDRHYGIQAFSVQFTADDPYFADAVEFTENVVEVADLLKTTFTLPTVFSKITTEADVINGGHIKSEPTFEVRNTGAAFVDKEIIIFNDTTGQKISFTTSMGKESIVIVDVKNREILQDGSDITHNITDDTYLSDFWLAPGSNHIRAETTDKSLGIGMCCKHKNRYIEAVY